MKCKCEGRVCTLCNGELVFPNGYVDPATGHAPPIDCFCDNGRVCVHVERKPTPSDPINAIAVCSCCNMYWTGDAA